MDNDIMIPHYDIEVDALALDTKRKYKYEVSKRVTNLVVIDLSDKNLPISVEILDASKVLNIKKNLLENIEGGKVAIKINDKIELSISLVISNDNNYSQSVNLVGDNETHIPDIETEFAIALA